MNSTYTFILTLKDGVKKSFSLHDEKFSLTYGISPDIWRSQNEIMLQVEIFGAENSTIVDNFIFENYPSLININDVQEIKMIINRIAKNEYKEYSFQAGDFNNLTACYLNNEDGNNGYIISFNITNPSILS